LDKDNAYNFLLKLKNKDSLIFRECMKCILQYKSNNINQHQLITKLEELTIIFPDIQEEILLFFDQRKVIFSIKF
jgi:hypothetical protein